MEKEKVINRMQEQAAAAWIHQLNAMRIQSLLNELTEQNLNFGAAMDTMNKALGSVKDLIESNRGGEKGMHGFIAEIAEVGIGNAKNQIKGMEAEYEWVNNNGPVDLIRNGVCIQQKFVQTGGHFSLNAIKDHLKKYPDYIKNKGKYQIPRNYYEKISYYLSISPEDANKMATADGEFSLKQWKYIHNFFENEEIKFESLEPAQLDYKEVQRNAIGKTLQHERKKLKETDRTIREEHYNAHRATPAEGAKAAAGAAAMEGGTAFAMAIAKKLKQGKRLRDFRTEDWREIIGDTFAGTLKGGVRGGAVYAMSNRISLDNAGIRLKDPKVFSKTASATASAVTTAAFGVAEQAYMLRKNKISETEFILNSEILCLEVSISALATFIGQALIPIPVMGAVIGSCVGTVMYQIAKENFQTREQVLMEQYLKSQVLLDERLNVRYGKYLEELKSNMTAYMSLLGNAFDPDVDTAFDGSIKLAQALHVPMDEILDTPEKVQDYFLE